MWICQTVNQPLSTHCCWACWKITLVYIMSYMLFTYTHHTTVWRNIVSFRSNMVTVFNKWIETLNWSPDLPSGGDVAHLTNKVSQKHDCSSAVLKNSIINSFCNMLQCSVTKCYTGLQTLYHMGSLIHLSEAVCLDLHEQVAKMIHW